MSVEGTSRALIASICAVLVLGACTDSPDEPQRGAAFTSAECPDDVDIMVVPKHSCGYVTTRNAGGDEVRLFVLQVEPPTPSTQAPIIETEGDLGTQASYGGLAPIPQRTGRRLIVVDLQGIGHSTPLLDCPEVNALAATAAADPDQSSGAVVDAIGACRERLTSQGIDLATFDVASTAENLHAVAQALGIPRSVAMGHGTTGAVAIEWARRYPDEVEALVLDSPQLHEPTPGAVVDRLVTQVSRLCAAAADCRRRYGDTAAQWPGLLRDLRRRPLVLLSRRPAGPPRRPGAAPGGALAGRWGRSRGELDPRAGRPSRPPGDPAPSCPGTPRRSPMGHPCASATCRGVPACPLLLSAPPCP